MSSDGANDPRHWKVKKRDGSRLEPANLEVLRHWVASRQIEADDLVINDELADWIRASEVIELFDLFEARGKKKEPQAPSSDKHEQKLLNLQEDDVEVPDCAFHSGRQATEICVGCGKFICEECHQRIEGKVYCRQCSAEKQVGAEPGVPAGSGPQAQIIPVAMGTSKLAVASLVCALISLASSVLMVYPRFVLKTAPAVGFVSFAATLMGGIALNRIRSRGGTSRSRSFAMTGLILGFLMLTTALAVVVIVPMRARRAGGTLEQTGFIPQSTRRQPPPDLTKEAQEEREMNAKQLLDQVAENLKEGKLEQAVSISKTIVGLYPDTQTAKLVEERLPTLEKALADSRAEAEETKRQDEQLSQQRFEHAIKMYSEGNRATALDLLKSIVENYPETNTAERARVEIAKIEKASADQQAKKLEADASQLAQKADQKMESEQYEEAAKLYQQIVNQYPQTPTASAVEPKLKEAELLVKDPSEREFRKIQKALDAKTYEESIGFLQDFLTKYPTSKRFDEVTQLLQKDQNSKSVADGLYQFGRTYFDEKRYSLAVGRYDKLIKEHPRSRWIPQAKKEYEEALKKLQQ